MEYKMKIKLLHKDAKLPKKMTPGSSGFDVFALKDLNITSYLGVVQIPLGISAQVPPGFEIQLRIRSSIASKGLILANGIGTIDSDYRGEIKALVFSLNETVKITKGDRIAQLVVVKIPEIEVSEVSELNPSVRGNGGFGSTDVKKILEASKEPLEDLTSDVEWGKESGSWTWEYNNGRCSDEELESIRKPMGDL
jgi:dUTP pyrophosphatase